MMLELWLCKKDANMEILYNVKTEVQYSPKHKVLRKLFISSPSH